MSLRARLIAVLLLLATAGMVVLSAVTYATQRSFLLDRVDDQTRAAEPALERALGVGPPPRGPGGPGGPDRPGRGRGGPREQANLPSGTYGELRTSDGRRLAAATISYGEAALPPPDLPDDLRLGDLRTVDAVSGDVRYRVRATDLRGPGDDGVLVVAIPLVGAEEALENLLLVEALVVLAVLLVLGLAASAIVRLGLRPLDRIAATADAIAGGDLSPRVEDADARTEVGRVGVAINAMLGRLEVAFGQREASEQRLRQFLADASHELRTPLSSIRGYAELHRMGAASDPAGTARAMGRIEDEAARMGVLVEDLLKLARLDELREPVREPVVLGDLVDDAVADARASAPERPIEAVVDDDVVVAGDPDQLRQVLLNLVRNALVHTPEGTPIEVRLHDDGGDAVVEVADRGPGLPEGDPSVVFGRFWRGEGPGRERGRAGAGLGLAIVQGIVVAHGGTVAAARRPGGGAVFCVRLPGLSAAGHG